MNEEIEYAEMLEIPVSTVNVLKKQTKKRRQKREKADRAELDGTLKNSLIEQVNDKLSSDTPEENGEPFEGLINYDETDGDFSERVDTVRLLSASGKRSKKFRSEKKSESKSEWDIPPIAGDETQNEGGVYETNKKSRASSTLLKIEFALACALSAGIFLTNVFMPTSGINTFFNSLNKTSVEGDARSYDQFTLSAVTSVLSDAETSVSETGVLTLTGECMVYPAADGTVSEVSQTGDGLYVVKLSHSDTFTGVVSGLNQVFYQVGDTVKGNVPMGFTNGESSVEITMYSEGELLNCFELDEDDKLVWIESGKNE